MLKHDDIVSAQQDLIAGNYDQLLSDLRRIGRPIKQAWLNSPLSDDNEKYKFTSNPKFKEFLLQQIASFKILKQLNIRNNSQLNQNKKQLSLLERLYIVWKDNPTLSQESATEQTEQLASLESEKKKLRQQIKFKASIDKDDRYAINIALQSMAFILCQQSNNFIKRQEKELGIHAILGIHAFTDEVISKKIANLKNTQDLRNYISDHIQSINNFESDRYIKVTNYELTSDQNLQEIEKIGRAISSFQTPNKKKKLLKYFGISLAFITALACGLSTGGAFLLLFPGSIVVPCLVGAFFFRCGFKSNYNFFSKNFPSFLLSLAKNGGITEFIDQNGKRKQLTNLHKYGTLPLIGLASVTVGIPAAAFTYLAILKFVTAFLPILAGIWPPLPLILVGFLAIALSITLTVSSFTATIDKFKKYLGRNTDSNENQLTFTEKFKALTPFQKFIYILIRVLMPAAVVGLLYYRIAAGIDLYNFVGVILSSIISVVAFFAQLAFTVNAVSKLEYAVTPKNDDESTNTSTSISLLSRLKSIISRIDNWACLIGNALGNGFLPAFDALSAPHSIIPLPLVISGSTLCGLNSLAGNIPEQDINRPKRSRATKALAKEVASFNTRTKADASATTYDSDLDNTQQPLKFSLNTNSGSYPKESNNANLPSPTGSENELLTKTSNNGYAHGSANFFQTAAAMSTAKSNDENKLVANR